MPEILSMIQVNKMTPAPAVLIVVSYAFFVILFYISIFRIHPQLKHLYLAKYCKHLKKSMNYNKMSFINWNRIQIYLYTSTVHICVSVDHKFHVMKYETFFDFCILKKFLRSNFSFSATTNLQATHFSKKPLSFYKDDRNNYLTDFIIS